MITPGLQTSEGKKSLGILITGALGVYYILSTRHQELPRMDLLLANAESAIDIAKAYSTTTPKENISSDITGQAFDASTIIAILFGMYKTFSKYTDERSGLKNKELDKDLKLKHAEAIIASYNSDNSNSDVDIKRSEDFKVDDSTTELKKF